MPHRAKTPKSPNKAYEGEPAVWRMSHMPMETAEALAFYGAKMLRKDDKVEIANIRPQFSPSAWTHDTLVPTEHHGSNRPRHSTSQPLSATVTESVLVSATTMGDTTTTTTLSSTLLSPSQAKVNTTSSHPDKAQNKKVDGSKKRIASAIAICPQITPAPSNTIMIREWERKVASAPPSPVLSAHELNHSHEEGGPKCQRTESLSQTVSEPQENLRREQYLQAGKKNDNDPIPLSFTKSVSIVNNTAGEHVKTRAAAAIEDLRTTRAHAIEKRDGRSLSPAATRAIRSALREQSTNTPSRNVHIINLSAVKSGQHTASDQQPRTRSISRTPRSLTATPPRSNKRFDAYANIVPDTSDYARTLDACADDLVKQEVAERLMAEKKRAHALATKKEVQDTYTRVYRALGRVKTRGTHVTDAVLKKSLQPKTDVSGLNSSCESATVAVQCDIAAPPPNQSNLSITLEQTNQQSNGLSTSETTSASQRTSPTRPIDRPAVATEDQTIFTAIPALPDTKQKLASASSTSQEDGVKSFILYKNELARQKASRLANPLLQLANDVDGHSKQKVSVALPRPPLVPARPPSSGIVVIEPPTSDTPAPCQHMPVTMASTTPQLSQTDPATSPSVALSPYVPSTVNIGNEVWNISLRSPIPIDSIELPPTTRYPKPDQSEIYRLNSLGGKLNSKGEFSQSHSKFPAYFQKESGLQYVRPLHQPRRAPYAHVPALDAKGVVVGPIVPNVSLEERVRLRALRATFAKMRRIAQHQIVSNTRRVNVVREAFSHWHLKATRATSLTIQAVQHHSFLLLRSVFTVMKVRMLSRAADECWRRKLILKCFGIWGKRVALGSLGSAKESVTNLGIAKFVLNKWVGRTRQQQQVRLFQIRRTFDLWLRRCKLCRLAKMIRADVELKTRTFERPKLLKEYFEKWRGAFISYKREHSNADISALTDRFRDLQTRRQMYHLFRCWREKLAQRRFEHIADGQRDFWLKQQSWFIWRASFQSISVLRSVGGLKSSVAQHNLHQQVTYNRIQDSKQYSPYAAKTLTQVDLRPMISPSAIKAVSVLGASSSPLGRAHREVSPPPIPASIYSPKQVKTEGTVSPSHRVRFSSL